MTIALLLIVIQLILYFADLTGMMSLKSYEIFMPALLLIAYALGYLLFEHLKGKVKK